MDHPLQMPTFWTDDIVPIKNECSIQVWQRELRLNKINHTSDPQGYRKGKKKAEIGHTAMIEEYSQNLK